MTLPASFSGSTKILNRWLSVVALGIGLLWFGWSAWQSWSFWQDKPLSGDQVTAKQLRVSEAQRQTLLTHLKSYQTPATVGIVPLVTFQGGTGS